MLVGVNGAGKSSFLQAIALTAQSALEQPRLIELVMQGSKWPGLGDDVRRVYFRHDPQLELSVRITFTIEAGFWKRNGLADISPWSDIPQWPPSRFSYTWTRQGSFPTAWSHRFELDDHVVWNWDAHLVREGSSHSASVSQDFSVLRANGSLLPAGRPLKTFERVLPEHFVTLSAGALVQSPIEPEIAQAVETASSILAPLVRQARSELDGVALIDPLRGKELVVNEPGDAPRTVGSHGEGLMRFLTSLHARSSGNRSSLESWVANFGLKSLESGAVEGNRLDLIAQDPQSQTLVGSLEFATGSFQALLLAAQLLLTPSGSIVLLEEPEANMHPEYERKLAELFADSVQLDNQVILTTHSEILIAAIANLVRRGKIPAANVGIFEIERTSAGASVSELPLTKDGLAKWVRSFARVEAELSKDWTDAIPEEG